MIFADETVVSLYGTGKSVYIVSLPKFMKRIKEKGLFAKLLYSKYAA